MLTINNVATSSLASSLNQMRDRARYGSGASMMMITEATTWTKLSETQTPVIGDVEKDNLYHENKAANRAYNK